MRRAWLSMIGAAVCSATISIEPATASPADMALQMRPVSSAPTASSSSGSWTDKLKFWDRDSAPKTTTPQAFQSPAAKSTTAISPWRHPITYFSDSVSNSRVAAMMHRDKTPAVAGEPADKIALSTPTGPATPKFYIAVAQLSEQQGKVQGARQQLQQGVKKWPRDVELLRASARLEDRQGNLPLAEALYRRAVAIDPQNAGALNDLGLCLARQNKFDQSIQSIEQAINLQPTKALYRNNAATVLVEMHQDQRALAHLSAVHGAAESNYNLGQLLVERGRPHEAATYFQQALAIDPSLQSAQVALAQLTGATAPSTRYAAESPVQSPRVTPVVGPQLPPQQPAAEPSFPSTARGPALGTSSYVAPNGYYYPTTAAPAAPAYETASRPRYLPPVRPITPGSMVR